MAKTLDTSKPETPLEECHRILATLKDHSCLVDRATIIRCLAFLLKELEGRRLS